MKSDSVCNLNELYCKVHAVIETQYVLQRRVLPRTTVYIYSPLYRGQLTFMYLRAGYNYI